jgi:hypothetical protein
VAYAEAKGCNEAILVYPGPLTDRAHRHKGGRHPRA